MKKVNGIFIFLATLAIFGIGVESFAKNHFIFSSQPNQPSAYSTIGEYRVEYDALGGDSSTWDGDSLEDARDSVENLRTRIANYRKILVLESEEDPGWYPPIAVDLTPSGPQGTLTLREARSEYNQALAVIGNWRREYLLLGGEADDWTGSYDDPDTLDVVEKSPNLLEASNLYEEIILEIKILKRKYLDLGGSANGWKGTYSYPGNKYQANIPTLSEAQALVQQILTQIANYRKVFGSGDQTWIGFPWTGSGPENTPTLIQAQNLHDDAVAEIARLKTDYLARGGSASDWTGTYDDSATLDVENTPTLSEAQALVELLKNSESSKILIIGLTAGIGGALLLCGGLGYWFYHRRKKS